MRTVLNVLLGWVILVLRDILNHVSPQFHEVLMDRFFNFRKRGTGMVLLPLEHLPKDFLALFLPDTTKLFLVHHFCSSQLETLLFFLLWYPVL